MRGSVWLMAGTAGLSLLAITTVFQPTERLIWNRSASAPEGFYWRYDRPPTRDDCAVVSPKSEAARWAREHGYTGENWPLIKRVAGLPGDEICRHGDTIFINGEARAEARHQSSNGIELHVWAGCRRLNASQIFLLNDHPASLDGRYFGPTPSAHISGSASLIWRF